MNRCQLIPRLLVGKSLMIWDHYLNQQEADYLFHTIMNYKSFERGTIKLFGKTHRKPRLESFHSIGNLSYSYSKNTLTTNPFTPELLEIKSRIEEVTGAEYNSVLINLYRHGKDSNGWHSDNEKELGMYPVIASLSLGAERRFRVSAREKEAKKLVFPMKHGDLLLMGAGFQENYSHSVPKDMKVHEPRINLTFRKILPV
jgi:alkylated DNA repair dioxygenase AlkB